MWYDKGKRPMSRVRLDNYLPRAPAPLTKVERKDAAGRAQWLRDQLQLLEEQLDRTSDGGRRAEIRDKINLKEAELSRIYESLDQR